MNHEGAGGLHSQGAKGEAVVLLPQVFGNTGYGALQPLHGPSGPFMRICLLFGRYLVGESDNHLKCRQEEWHHAAVSGKCDVALPVFDLGCPAASNETLKTASEQDLERADIKPHQLRSFAYLPFCRRSSPNMAQMITVGLARYSLRKAAQQPLYHRQSRRKRITGT